MALNQRLGLTRYDADQYYKLALEAYGKRNIDDAVDNITKAIELLPNNAEYYSARGLFQLEDAAIAEAKEDFEQAIKLFAYEMLAHYGLGVLAYRDEEWDIALKHFTTAYHVDPERPETLYYLSLLYMQKGNFPGALELMTRAQAAFEKKGDKRSKSHTDRWLREFAKLAKRTAEALSRQNTLPTLK